MFCHRSLLFSVSQASTPHHSGLSSDSDAAIATIADSKPKLTASICGRIIKIGAEYDDREEVEDREEANDGEEEGGGGAYSSCENSNETAYESGFMEVPRLREETHRHEEEERLLEEESLQAQRLLKILEIQNKEVTSFDPNKHMKEKKKSSTAALTFNMSNQTEYLDINSSDKNVESFKDDKSDFVKPRGRGRPPKLNNGEALVSDKSDFVKPRGRGRPPKLNSGEALLTDKSDYVKPRGRGRPRKQLNVSTEPESPCLISSKSNDISFNCPKISSYNDSLSDELPHRFDSHKRKRKKKTFDGFFVTPIKNESYNGENKSSAQNIIQDIKREPSAMENRLKNNIYKVSI